jgi:hypothetical protein
MVREACYIRKVVVFGLNKETQNFEIFLDAHSIQLPLSYCRALLCRLGVVPVATVVTNNEGELKLTLAY